MEYFLAGNLPAGAQQPFASVTLEEFKPEGEAEPGQPANKSGAGQGAGGQKRKARLAALARLSGGGNGAPAARVTGRASPSRRRP